MPAVNFMGQWVTPDESQRLIREAAERSTNCIRRNGKQESIRVKSPQELVGKFKRVTVVRNMGLGDVLLITPLVRALHKQLGLKVDVLTNQEYVPLFRGNPNVDRIGVIDSPNMIVWPEQSDAVLDLRDYVENPAFQQQNRAVCFMESAGFTNVAGDDIRLDYFVHPSESEWAKETLCKPFSGAVVPEKLIGYVWRASTAQRSWSHGTHCRNLAAMAEDGYSVVVFDHLPQDVPQIDNVFDATGQYSIREVAAMMSLCNAVVTPDTGTFHLAQALGVRTLAYFGPFPIEDRQTNKKTLAVINKKNADCEMRPCRLYSCPFQDEEGQSICLRVSTETLLKFLRFAMEPAK